MAVEVVIEAGVLGAVSVGGADSMESLGVDVSAGAGGSRGGCSGTGGGGLVGCGVATGDPGGFWKYGSEAVANLPDQLFVRGNESGTDRLPSKVCDHVRGLVGDQLLSLAPTREDHTDSRRDFVREESRLSWAVWWET